MKTYSVTYRDSNCYTSMFIEANNPDEAEKILKEKCPGATEIKVQE